MTFTFVAVQGPLFLTVIVNTILSLTLTVFVLISTVLLICKSTMSNEVMFSMLSLLFDLFVSLSEPNIATALEIVPADITSAMIVRLWVSPLFKSPTIHVAPS